MEKTDYIFSTFNQAKHRFVWDMIELLGLRFPANAIEYDQRSGYRSVTTIAFRLFLIKSTFQLSVPQPVEFGDYSTKPAR